MIVYNVDKSNRTLSIRFTFRYALYATHIVHKCHFFFPFTYVLRVISFVETHQAPPHTVAVNKMMRKSDLNYLPCIWNDEGDI